MTNQELADLIFPNITKTIEDYEQAYPARDLKEGAKVVRFAPSPTGFMHIGNMMSATINYCLAASSNGIFYLRNEDTDQARSVEGAVEFIHHILKHYHIYPDEYEYEGKIVGNYGPYIQSERIEIYHAFIKHLIAVGKAYPCFLTSDELNEIRAYQEKNKKRIGIYGRYAKFRDVSNEEAAKRIKAGEKFTIRFRSEGDFNKKFIFEDLTKGKIELPENDIDVPIMKSENLLPTYHFAHVVDDHLMRTTHVVRGEEWLSSVPLHYELFSSFGFKMPKYIHTSLILKKDGDTIRKISKRKDPEALMFYYEDHDYYPLDNSVPPGYPPPPRGKSGKEDHLTEVGFGVACLGGYRFPVGKEFNVDLQTGPYYSIAFDQHQTIFGHHRFDLYNKSSLRWRFGLGLNVWRLTVDASFDLGLLKVRPEREHSDRESNVVSVGIGYNF